MKNSIDTLTQYGYERFTLTMFWEELVDLLDFLATSEKDMAEKKKILHEKLTEEQGISDYASWYLRVIVAAYLKADPDRFLGFLENDCYDIATFCTREVEPMGKECGMVQVLALAEAFQVWAKIEYLDRNSQMGNGSGPVVHCFGNEKGLELNLLYRPGHYDILYKK